MLLRLTGIILFSTFCSFATAQELEVNLDSLLNAQAFTAESDLQKGLNKNVKVAALKLSSRESPSIITVVSNEEITNSGARDLTDVLRLVPGFDVMQDLQLVMGLSLRGNWSNEGKILVLLDGVPMNDLLYQSVAVGNRFPVDAIDRLEIIRGPGSAIYGGSAEYGVINIITKAAESLNGVQVYGIAGFHSDAVGRSNGGVMIADHKEDFSWDVAAFKGNGIISDQLYNDFFGDFDTQDLARTTSADPMNLNVGLRVKKFSIRSMYDVFETSEPGSKVSFRNFFVDSHYDIAASEKLTITPRIQYTRQIPWSYDQLDEPGVDFKIEARRSLGQVDMNYNLSRKVNLLFGAVYFQDQSRDLLADEKLLTLNNVAVYTQALFKHRLANATVGFRFEKNNRYDGAFVPRIALTKKVENFHFKILYSKSFRSPSLQNVLLDTTGAEPERSNVYELELGYQFTPEMLLAVNTFRITTRNIIIYGSDEDFNEWYENYDKSGTEGVEIVYNLRKKNWYTNFSYSFSRAISDNTVEKYNVAQTKNQYVGIAAHKFTLNTNVYVAPWFSVNPTIIHSGKRYAYLSYADEPTAEELKPYTLVNVFLNFKPQSFRGFTAGVGVYDLLNERPLIPQAYAGGAGSYAAIPGRSREYVVKISYQIPFSK